MYKQKNIITELLFYFFIIVMFIEKGFGLYDGLVIYKILFIVTMLAVFLKLALEEHTFYEWSFIILSGILVVIINRVSGEKGPLIIYAMMFGMQNIPLKRIMKIGVLCLGLSAVINAIIYMLRVPNVHALIRSERLGIIKLFAWDLGQPHPNTTATVYLALVAMIILLLGGNYSWRHMLLLSVGDCIIYFFCVSNTGFLVSLTLIVLSYFSVHIHSISKWGYGIMVMAYPVCVLFSCAFPWIIPRNVLLFLKVHMRTIYHRIMLSREFASVDNLRLFGVNVASLTDSQFTLDNSFLYCIVFNGVVCFCLLSIGYVFFIHKYIKEKRNLELCITMCFLMKGILEPFLFNTSFKNITIFFLGECLWEYFRGKRKEESKLFCILQLPERIIKLLSIERFYTGSMNMLDGMFEEKKNAPKKKILLPVLVGIVISAIIIIIFPITEDFFVSSDIYNVLVEHNQLVRAITLETMRRFVFVFVLSAGMTYLIFNYWTLNIRIWSKKGK